MAEHQDGVIEAARKIDTMVHGSNDRNSVITDVNSYLTKNPTLVSDPDRCRALSQLLAAKGDLPEMMVGEYSQAAVDQASDPLTKLLGKQTVLGSSDTEIQTNAKTLAEGEAAREGVHAFTEDQWKQIFHGHAGQDDIRNALQDRSLNLTDDQRKALTDIDANFEALRTSGWKFWDRHTVCLDKLQDDIDNKDGGIRGKELAALDGVQTKAQAAAKDGTVTVNVESGEGWQNVAAKALGYDIRLRTQADWDAVPQLDINKIYGLANYFKSTYTQQNSDPMLHPGALDLKVPEKFQTS